MTWSQPVCDACWWERNPDRWPYRMRDADTEKCCHCGASTRAGVYVRVDPRTVKYPKEDK